MKRKYSAALALLLWLGVVAWVSAMIVAKPSVRRAFGDDSDSAQIAQLQLELGKNRGLLAMLDQLLSGGIEADAGPLLATPKAGAMASTDNPEASSELEAPVVHSLSLIVTSDRGRRAQVDGQWASLGQRLVGVVGVRHSTDSAHAIGTQITLFA